MGPYKPQRNWVDFSHPPICMEMSWELIDQNGTFKTKNIPPAGVILNHVTWIEASTSTKSVPYDASAENEKKKKDTNEGFGWKTTR